MNTPGFLYLPGLGVFILSGGGGAATVAYDLLSDLTAAEISISGASTATISRMHVCSGTTYTLTLPAVSGNTGKFLGVRITATGLVTLDGNASEAIDGAATRVMWAGESALLLCDGSNWFKIAGKSLPMIALMYLSADQAGFNSTTVTKVNLDTTLTDNTGLLADTTNKRINIKRASPYLIAGHAAASNIVGAGYFGPYLYINGANIKEGITVLGGYTAQVAVMDNYALAVSDTVELYALQSGGSNNQSMRGGAAGAQACHLSVTEVCAW